MVIELSQMNDLTTLFKIQSYVNSISPNIQYHNNHSDGGEGVTESTTNPKAVAIATSDTDRPSRAPARGTINSLPDQSGPQTTRRHATEQLSE